MASPVSLKLLIDTKSNRVLFAEAGKDFVDFLFNLLTLHVGTVIWLLTKNSMVGSLGNLYGSIEELDNTYLQTIHSKDSLLEPKASVSAAHVPLLPASANQKCYVAKSKKIYMCSNEDYFDENCSYTYVSTDSKTVCPTCNYTLSKETSYVGGENIKEDEPCNLGGFVKGVVTYIVMDNLVVTPMSTISSITMLNKFNIKEVGALAEKVVDLDMAQACNVIQFHTSLMSPTGNHTMMHVLHRSA